jgi:ubiquinone/menaquinone biosynthesis C-methylase UbiE
MALGPDQLLDVLRAAGEQTRLRILALLAQGELAVGEIAGVLGQSQPRVSRHLKLLVEARLVERRPEGAWVFFRLDPASGEADVARSLLAGLDGGDPMLTRDQERLSSVRAARAREAAAYFEAHAAEFETLRRLHQPEAAVEQALLAAAGPGPFEFHLDLGAGPGRILELFAPLVRRGEGVDASRKMIAVARAKLDQLADARLSVRLADALALPHADGAADLVTLHQVLHYLADPAAAVAEAARVLAPGGRLLIADFAPHDFEELRSAHQHRRLGFADEEIAQACADAGLAVDTVTRIAPEADTPALAVTIWSASRPQTSARRAA